MRYRSLIPNPAHVAPIGIVVTPGQEFDSPIGLWHPELVPLDDEAKAHAAEREAENARHAETYRQRTQGQNVQDQLPPVDYRAALGLDTLSPTPEPTEEERRVRGLLEPAPPTPEPPTPKAMKAKKE